MYLITNQTYECREIRINEVLILNLSANFRKLWESERLDLSGQSYSWHCQDINKHKEVNNNVYMNLLYLKQELSKKPIARETQVKLD